MSYGRELVSCSGVVYLRCYLVSMVVLVGSCRRVEASEMCICVKRKW